MMEEIYLKAHRQLMDELRRQMKRKNPKKIRQVGARLHRLRVRYRKQRAA